jgi:hypothetical protein
MDEVWFVMKFMTSNIIVFGLHIGFHIQRCESMINLTVCHGCSMIYDEIKNVMRISPWINGFLVVSDYGKYISTRRTCEEKSQLEAYLNDTVEDIDDNLDVLDYWNKASSHYLEVALMSHDILAIPLFSVAS